MPCILSIILYRLHLKLRSVLNGQYELFLYRLLRSMYGKRLVSGGTNSQIFKKF